MTTTSTGCKASWWEQLSSRAINFRARGPGFNSWFLQITFERVPITIPENVYTYQCYFQSKNTHFPQFSASMHHMYAFCTNAFNASTICALHKHVPALPLCPYSTAKWGMSYQHHAVPCTCHLWVKYYQDRYKRLVAKHSQWCRLFTNRTGVYLHA